MFRISKKTIVPVLVFALLVSTGAFAQLALGWTGATYYNSGVSTSQVIQDFQDGNGIFYGPFVELGMGKLALGGAFNFSFYNQVDPYAPAQVVEMMDYDGNFYMQGHLFGYKSLLDPFLEVGIGRMATDYADSADDPDSDNPLRGTNYWQAGGGMGVNLGPLGVFAKLLYMMPIGAVETNSNYSLENYPLKDLKVFVGAKLIL
ncbi:MAG: hypothetical protein WBH97_02660 [Rectinemataceae bacterium]